MISPLALMQGTGFGYYLDANEMEITLLGPHTEWFDVDGRALMCGHHQTLIYGTDSVEVEQTIYLSVGSCRAALARERLRKSRLPVKGEEMVDGEDAQIAAQSPSLGSC